MPRRHGPNKYDKDAQVSLNDYLKSSEKRLDKYCDSQDVLNAPREPLEEFNKRVGKLGGWMKNAEKNCKTEFPPQKKK